VRGRGTPPKGFIVQLRHAVRMSVHGAKASLASLAASSPTLFGTPSRREESWQGYDPEFPSSPLPGRQSAGTSDYYIHGSFAASPGAKALRPFKDSSSVGRRSTERDSVSPSFPTSSRLFERRIVGAMGAAPTELECCRPTRASMRKQLLYHDVVDPTKLRVELWSMPEPDLRERALRENVDRGALEEVGDTWKEGIINLILEKHRAVAVQQPHAKSQLVVPTHAGKGFDNKRLGRHAHRWFSAPHHISQSMHHNGSLLKKHTVHSEMTVHGSEPRAHNKFVQVHREPNTLDTFPLRNVEEMRVQIDRRDPRPDSVYTVGEGGSKVALRHVCWTGTDHDDPQGRHSKQRKPRVPCLAEQDSVTKLSFATHVRRSCMDPSYAFEPGARYTSGQSRRPAKKQTERYGGPGLCVFVCHRGVAVQVNGLADSGAPSQFAQDDGGGRASCRCSPSH
jgi:hypothetical protein